jgi:hypothetical protein
VTLTPNFSLSEFRRTSAPFVNNPGPIEQKNLHILCLAILQPVRNHYGKPVVVTSGFRNASTNEWVKGAKDSQHTKGEAADIHVAGVSGYDLAKWIARNTSFDQIILYPGQDRIHVSYRSEADNRRSILMSEGGGYKPYPLHSYGWAHER